MYRRFLNNNDYLGIITAEALAQLTRGNDDRFIQAEESAEMSIVEYLSENYEIEKELAKGKYIAEYDSLDSRPLSAGDDRLLGRVHRYECRCGAGCRLFPVQHLLSGRQGELQWCRLYLSCRERLQVR